MAITIEDIREIKEGNVVKINGIKHVCTMAVGYLSNYNMNFRFTNMNLPKNIRHTNNNEYYLQCECLLKRIKTNVIEFLILDKSISVKDKQLELF